MLGLGLLAVLGAVVASPAPAVAQGFIVTAPNMTDYAPHPVRWRLSSALRQRSTRRRRLTANSHRTLRSLCDIMMTTCARSLGFSQSLVDGSLERLERLRALHELAVDEKGRRSDMHAGLVDRSAVGLDARLVFVTVECCLELG